MRAGVIALIGILAASMVVTTVYLDILLRGSRTVQIVDILDRASAYNNTVVQLHGRLEPYSPEPWSSYPPVYGLLRDETGAIVLFFPSGYPARYAYGEVNITGEVCYVPRHYIPGLWLYVEVSSYQGRESTLRLELRRTGGIAGVNDLLVVEVEGSGRYTRGFVGGTAFKLSEEQLYQLRALIIGNDFAETEPEEFGAKQGVADYFTYSLAVTYFRDGKETSRKTVSWVDEWALKEQLPESLGRIHKGLEALIAEIVASEGIDEGEAARTAISAVRDSTTFQFDGVDGSLKAVSVSKVVNEPPTPGFFWLVKVTFLTAHPGHGNRSGLILLQVITEHKAIVALDERGGVITAVCDEGWDLLADKELPAQSTRPVRFIVVVNEAGKLDVYVDVDLVDGVSMSEEKLIAEVTFTAVMGEKVLRRLDKLTLEGDILHAHYTWGYDAADLSHVFYMTADLSSHTIVVTHCL